MKSVYDRLAELRDDKNADFQAKLTPTLNRDLFMGVRVPEARKLAKQLVKENVYEDFLNQLPHDFYDENILHGLIISELKDYDDCLRRLKEFLPYVDNWAVCDITSPKVFKKNKQRLMEEIVRWSRSEEIYTCRFGLEMLMSHFLDADFKPEYLNIAAEVVSEEYYVNMMIAWFFATALAKQWEATIPYIEGYELGDWVHNKTIQKACESYRITPEEKEYLKSFRKRGMKS